MATNYYYFADPEHGHFERSTTLRFTASGHIEKFGPFALAVPWLLISEEGHFPFYMRHASTLDHYITLHQGYEVQIERFLKALAHRQIADRMEPAFRLIDIYHRNQFLENLSDPSIEDQAADLKWAFMHDEIEAAIAKTIARIKTAEISPRWGSPYLKDDRIWEPLFPYDLSIPNPCESILSGVGIGVKGTIVHNTRKNITTINPPSSDGTPSEPTTRLETGTNTLSTGHYKLDKFAEHQFKIEGTTSQLVLVNLNADPVTFRSKGQDIVVAGHSEHILPTGTKEVSLRWTGYSGNANLSSLELVLPNIPLVPAFSADVTEYTVRGISDYLAPEVRAVAAHADATIEITRVNGVFTQGEGYSDGLTTITVTADDGTVKVYRITSTN